MYTINKIAKLSGVTTRTLRYYDSIGLLTPSSKTEAGYRIYTEKDLAKLQQILFFRELNFELSKIKEILSTPNFSRVEALKLQAELLKKEGERYLRLSELALNTINSIEGEKKMSSRDMFSGFDYDKMIKEQKQYESEVKERWGDSDLYKISKERTSKLSKADWENLNEIQMKNIKELCTLYKEKAEAQDERVQKVVEAGFKFINDNFYPCTLEIFSGLGEMYVCDERFKNYYDKFEIGLAEFYNEAIQHFCITRS